MGVGLLREYVWLDGKPLAVIEGGRTFHVRWDQIGRPVLATELIGGVVYEAWTADYLPFGGVHVATGPVPALRFPGQWFQAGEPRRDCSRLILVSGAALCLRASRHTPLLTRSGLHASSAGAASARRFIPPCSRATG